MQLKRKTEVRSWRYSRDMKCRREMEMKVFAISESDGDKGVGEFVDEESKARSLNSYGHASQVNMKRGRPVTN